jgi:hypothetical protein
MKTIGLLLCVCCVSFELEAQQDDSTHTAIENVIQLYFEGTANGEPEKLLEAFHPDFNLYTVNDKDSLWIRSGKAYIDKIKVGEKNNRQGSILLIDYAGNTAMAKAEILVPGWRLFTDYFLLMRYQGEWKIVQKSYSWEPVGSKP